MGPKTPVEPIMSRATLRGAFTVSSLHRERKPPGNTPSCLMGQRREEKQNQHYIKMTHNIRRDYDRTEHPPHDLSPTTDHSPLITLIGNCRV